MHNPTDESAVRNLIARFANSFDLKAWNDLESCLTDSLHTDYSDLRGTPPETMTKGRFVELRSVALQEMRTHHLAGNIELRLEDKRGTARVSMLIYRLSPDGAVLNTHCLYLFEIRQEAGAWRINSIVQKMYWSDGNPSIHKGIVKA